MTNIEKTKTKWQDIVICLMQIIFIVSLIPTIIGLDKPPLITSFLTASALTIISYCVFTLRLYYSGITAFIVALEWYIIFVQKLGII